MIAMCTMRLTAALSLRRGPCGSSGVSPRPWPEANAGPDTHPRRKSMPRGRRHRRAV